METEMRSSQFQPEISPAEYEQGKGQHALLSGNEKEDATSYKRLYGCLSEHHTFMTWRDIVSIIIKA